MSISPYKVHIPDAELDLLKQKLKLSRIPPKYVDWEDDNGITPDFVKKTIDYWLEEYDWRAEEAEINKLPQFMTQIETIEDYGTLDIHFVHSKSSKANATPLLFIHGWPGSFIEITKGLKLLNDAGLDVVAPSLPGYGFSSYPRKKGFKIRHHAAVFQKLMLKLGYNKFVTQGGDWGSHICRAISVYHEENVLAMHLNMFQTPQLDWPNGEPKYTEREQSALDRLFKWFMGTNTAYGQVHATKPTTIGLAMHDSPVGMLAWMYDKLDLWTDGYPWTQKEVITWTLLHYFPGPTTGFMMYFENSSHNSEMVQSWRDSHINVPTGCSSFPKELAMMPKSWVERKANVKFYRYHDKGGHFAMHERPEVLVGDMLEFYESVLGKES